MRQHPSPFALGNVQCINSLADDVLGWNDTIAAKRS